SASASAESCRGTLRRSPRSRAGCPCPRRAAASTAGRRARARRTKCARRRARTPRRAPALIPARPRRGASLPAGLRYLLAPVAQAELFERGAVELIAAHHGDPALRRRPQCRRALPAFQNRAFAEDRAGAELRQRLAIDLDREHAVEHEEHLAAVLTLL